jgi:hypothetical protein
LSDPLAVCRATCCLGTCHQNFLRTFSFLGWVISSRVELPLLYWSDGLFVFEPSNKLIYTVGISSTFTSTTCSLALYADVQYPISDHFAGDIQNLTPFRQIVRGNKTPDLIPHIHDLKPIRQSILLSGSFVVATHSAVHCNSSSTMRANIRPKISPPTLSK